MIIVKTWLSLKNTKAFSSFAAPLPARKIIFILHFKIVDFCVPAFAALLRKSLKLNENSFRVHKKNVVI